MPFAPQSVSIMHFQEHCTTDGTDGTDDGNAECRVRSAEFLSVKSVKSVVQFLWLRQAALSCNPSASRISDKIFPSPFSQFAVKTLRLRPAALCHHRKTSRISDKILRIVIPNDK